MTEFVGSIGNHGFTGRIDVSPTTPVSNLPTITVLRKSTVSVAGIYVLNLLAGVLATIQSASLVSSQKLLILATGGTQASVKLDSNGTIGGASVAIIQPGTFTIFQFDGTNLNAVAGAGLP